MSSSFYRQCFICRQWSWDVCGVLPESGRVDGLDLCLPCYVDVLEVRQARGAMVKEHSASLGGDGREARAGAGSSPSLTSSEWPDQLDLFDS